MTTTIQSVAALPDKCPIPEIQGRVTAVYKARDYQGKSIQDFELSDAGGNKIKCTAWEHSDLSGYKDKEIILHAGPKGGLVVKYDDYKKANGISISRTCTFQFLAVHQAQGGSPAPIPANPSPSVAPGVSTPPPPAQNGLKSINGAKVGMALNLVSKILMDSGLSLGDPGFYKELAYHASRVIEVSDWLESGHLMPKRTDEATPEAPVPQVEVTKPKQDDGDVPF